MTIGTATAMLQGASLFLGRIADRRAVRFTRRGFAWAASRTAVQCASLGAQTVLGASPLRNSRRAKRTARLSEGVPVFAWAFRATTPGRSGAAAACALISRRDQAHAASPHRTAPKPRRCSHVTTPQPSCPTVSRQSGRAAVFTRTPPQHPAPLYRAKAERGGVHMHDCAEPRPTVSRQSGGGGGVHTPRVPQERSSEDCLSAV